MTKDNHGYPDITPPDEAVEAGVPTETQRAPSAEALARLRDAILPGARMARPHRMPGGATQGVYALDLVAPSGARQHLILRRYAPNRLVDDPEVCIREWRTLAVLQQAGINAPRPVWLDADGAIFGVAAMVTTRLAGRPLLAPHDLAGWTQQLAHAIAAIHRCTPASYDLSFLPVLKARFQSLFEEPDALHADHGIARHREGAAMWSAMRHWWPRLRWNDLVLMHGDYAPTNTLWSRGRITGVVDWEWAHVGPAATDLATCRLELGLCVGQNAADRFLDDYEAITGRPVAHMFFWDLLRLWIDLPAARAFIFRYQDHGLMDLTAEVVQARLDAMIANALVQASRS